jgi:hypothetical protein
MRSSTLRRLRCGDRVCKSRTDDRGGGSSRPIRSAIGKPSTSSPRVRVLYSITALGEPRACRVLRGLGLGETRCNTMYVSIPPGRAESRLESRCGRSLSEPWELTVQRRRVSSNLRDQVVCGASYLFEGSLRNDNRLASRSAKLERASQFPMRGPSFLIVGVLIWLLAFFAFFYLFVPWGLLPLTAGGLLIWHGIRRSEMGPLITIIPGSVLLAVGVGWLVDFSDFVYPTWPYAYCHSACTLPAPLALQPVVWLSSLVASTGLLLLAGGWSRHAEVSRLRSRSISRISSPSGP